MIYSVPCQRILNYTPLLILTSTYNLSHGSKNIMRNLSLTSSLLPLISLQKCTSGMALLKVNHFLANQLFPTSKARMWRKWHYVDRNLSELPLPYPPCSHCITILSMPQIGPLVLHIFTLLLQLEYMWKLICAAATTTLTNSSVWGNLL